MAGLTGKDLMVNCSRCSRPVIVLNQGSELFVPAHYANPETYRFCSLKGYISITDYTSSISFASSMLQVVRLPGGAGGSGKSASVPAPVPTELCKGGPSPASGCKDCGDILFKNVTGQAGKKILPRYEDWRAQFVEHGTAWAKERMLDYMSDWHKGVLAEDWKPDGEPQPQPQPQLQSLVTWCTWVCLVMATVWAVVAVVTDDPSWLMGTALNSFCASAEVSARAYGNHKRKAAASRKKLIP